MGGRGSFERFGGEVELDAIAPVVFGFVEGLVGGLEELTEILSMLWKGGNADGYGDMEDFGVVAIGANVEFGDLCAQSVGEA